MRNGFGELFFKNGDYYRGELEKDEFCGRGLLKISSTQEVYEGDFRDNLKDGLGSQSD